MNWDDQTTSEPIAKKVYDILLDQWQRFRRASSIVEMAGHCDSGVQTFRLERKRAVQVLNDWYGSDVVEDFEKLPATLLNLHPSILSSNAHYREWAKDEVENHAAFFFALMEDVKYRPLNFNGDKIKWAHETILRVFFDASDKPDANKSLELLIDGHGLSMEELVFHLEGMKSRGLLREADHDYTVTPKGVKELKRMENEAPETLEQKRFRVLKTLYDLAPDDKHGMVIVEMLARVLGMQFHEANRILLYWEEKGMVQSPSDEAVALTASAIDELEDKINHPRKSTQHFPSTINLVDNSVHIGGTVQGNVVGGQDNAYNAITNESIAAVVPQLAKLIEELKKAEFEYRDEVISDLEQVHKLAQRSDSPGMWEAISAKFKSAESMLKISGYAYQALNYWPVLVEFFHRIR